MAQPAADVPNEAAVQLSRRDWIARYARHTLLAGFAVLMWRITRRGPPALCHRPDWACQDCRLLARCRAGRGVISKETVSK